MKTAVILHGMPSKKEYYNPQHSSESNKHWLPWLQKQLLLHDILAQTPELPVPYNPEFKDWSSLFERLELNDDTILVGHSCGAGFLVRWLSENKVKVGRVALVAPWLDPEHSMTNGFLDFSIDSQLVERTDGINIFISSDDGKEMLDSVDMLNSSLKGLSIRKFDDRGHFTLYGMKTEEFPELLDALV